MTATAQAGFRTVAFGDLDAHLWGAAWLVDSGGPTFAALGADGTASGLQIALDGGGEAEEWQLHGDGVDLTLAADGDAARVSVQKPDLQGFEQLCRVKGRFSIAGTERAVDCQGRRGVRSPRIDFDRLESIRDISAWFGPGEGLALIAARPQGQRGQEGDVLTAALFEPERSGHVTDPRLSTTYSGSGQPARVGLELWLGEEGEEEQYSRRAAGEAAGARAEAEIGGFQVLVQALRWHSRGHDGTGTYVLARRM